MARLVDLDAQNVAQNITVHVKLKRLGQWRARMWIAEKLIRLAVWIAWLQCDLEVID